MASVSGATTSLGNTSLRGFGGLASGIDRDSIIEQMSLASTTKIQNQKNAITSLTWKQEAFRSIIDKILDLQDNYLSYSGKSNMLDSSMFAKSVLTANGDEKVTKYLKASGSSELLDYMSVRGVESLATAANVQSKAMEKGSIQTEMGFFDDAKTSNLEGKQLIFGEDQLQGKFNNVGTFTFYSSYKDKDNITHNIDYTGDIDQLAKDLNAAIDANRFTIREGSDGSGTTIEFSAVDDGHGNKKLAINYAKVTGIQLNNGWKKTPITNDDTNFIVRSNSTALSALGLDEKAAKEAKDSTYGYKLGTVNANISSDDFQQKSVTTYDNMASYLQGKKFTVTYGGTSKSMELITSSDVKALEEMWKELDGLTGEAYETKKTAINQMFRDKMQSHLNQAFGTGKVGVRLDDATGKLSFYNQKDDDTTLTVSANSWSVSRVTGLDKMNSNKISLDSSLYDNRDRLGLPDMYTVTREIEEEDEESGEKITKTVEENVSSAKISKEDFNAWLKTNAFEINGVKIDVNCDTTINQLMDKVNSSGAGVRMNYLNTSNKFTLVSKETGSGREITFGKPDEDISTSKNIAAKLFGGEGSFSKDGTDAVMYVDYGTGEAEKIVSSSNTFDLDGLKVTVSGTFGISGWEDEKDKDGNSIKKPIFDTSQAVTFDAKADVDNAVEKVKKFIEDFNALVKEVNTQITTKPDKDYGPLTDAQKDEMDDTSIENWEKKAKEGLLFNNASMRDLSMDIQGILTNLMGNGVFYDDLEEIGITASQDIYDGGTLVFDESKFRAAMESNPEKVGNIIAGGGNVRKGLGSIMNDTLKTYATRYAYLNGGSYGRLVEEAGSEKISLSVQNNTFYKQLKDMQEALTDLQTRLKSEQDRYIRQFTQMEQAISNMNSQSSYLSSLGG